VAAVIIEAMISHLEYSIHVFGIAVCFAWILRMRGPVQGAWGDVSATCFTMAYVGIPMAVLIHIFTSGNEGQAWLLMTLGVIWSTDSFALFVGKLAGKHKMWPKISPGKTWEGSIGGLLGGFLVILIARQFFNEYFHAVSDLELILFVLLFSPIAQLGDLAESLLKRDVGVKDSGSELTGHGGFLDLMDAVLFSAVPLLIFLELFHPQVLAS
jgi:phosphatidate cytidylyltransferase